jgi:hypothetical protein
VEDCKVEENTNINVLEEIEEIEDNYLQSSKYAEA